MRAAGCTVNDMADRDFDARVARTANRPLASGAVTLRQAVLFLAGLLGLGFAVLIQFNTFAVWVGIGSLPLVAFYPFMKRVTYWPQAWLGLTFNWGALVGWAAVRGDLAWPAVILYAAGFFWTLGYDTIYAHQDKEDDLLVGVKSTALRLGSATRPWLFGFFGVAIALLAAAGWLDGLAWPFYAGLAVGALHLGWQAWAVDTDDPKDCLSKFKSNRDFALIVFAAIVAAQILD
jgi:4-hydroxybenzoate polyprenyltransferase